MQVKSLNIQELVAEFGIKNLRIFFTMTRLNVVPMLGIAFKSSSDPKSMQECEIVETRYKVDEGYKVTLKALDPSYGQEHFYQMDLNQLMHRGQLNGNFKVYVLSSDGYSQLKVSEPKRVRHA